MKRLTRRELLRGALALTSTVLLAGCRLLPSPAQQQARVPRIGFLSPGSLATSVGVEPLREGLRELGWVEGQISQGSSRQR